MSLVLGRAQRGGTVLGLIIGLLIGLGVALAVALYIAKVPVPFVDKVPHRTPEQEAAEIERNKNWDPNAPLAGKQPIKPVAAPEAASAPTPSPVAAAASRPAAAASSAAEKRAARASEAAEAAKSSRDPAAILAGGATPAPAKSAASATASGGKDSFIYFVQAGAYSNADDAEQQRARLAMQGLGAKVTEREQAGRTVHRVRLGPFETKDEAEASQEKLRGAGAEAVLVRVERNPR
jgi:cell division protein FtsN